MGYRKGDGIFFLLENKDGRVGNFSLMVFSIVLVLFFLGFAMAFSIDFENPTPVNATSNNSILINISSNVSGDSYAFADWDKSLTH